MVIVFWELIMFIIREKIVIIRELIISIEGLIKDKLLILVM